MKQFKLAELAELAGTSARTIRYYVQRGLLPAPEFHGKDTAYGHDHLVRLRAIKVLQAQFFPLDAIEAELARRSPGEIEEIAKGQAVPVVGPSAAPPSVRPKVQPAAKVWRRIELAEGVELALAEDAPAESRAIVERILSELGGAAR